MVAPYATMKTNSGNKCPHGLPIGTCPICSNMGGRQSNRKKKNSKNYEMSYRECMAQWLQMRALKFSKETSEKNRIRFLSFIKLQNLISSNLTKLENNFNKLIQNVEKLPKIISTPVKVVLNIIVKPVLNILMNIPQAINNIQTFFSNVRHLLYSVSEKMAMVLGEIKNFIDFKISKPIKKMIRTILTFFSSNEEDDNEEKEKLKMIEIKKVIQKLFIKKKTKREKAVENAH